MKGTLPARAPRARWRAFRRCAVVGGMTLAIVGCGGEKSLKAGEPPSLGTIEDLTAKRPDFTIGAITIRDSGQDVEVLRVRALTSPNLQYLGAFTTWPQDGKTSAVGSALGYPGDRGGMVTHPAFGVVIPAAEAAHTLPGEDGPRPVFVAAGFRLTSGEVGLLHVVEVTYRVGKTVRTERSRDAILSCFSPCKAKPKGVRLEDWEHQVREELGLVERDSRDLPGPTQTLGSADQKSAGPYAQRTTAASRRAPSSRKSPAPPASGSTPIS